MPILFRLLVALGGLALGALIVLAFQTGDFLAAGGWMMSDPWGQVTLADLYLGFLITAVLIAFLEPKRWLAAVWILPLPVLGNVWAAIWLVVRWRAIRARLVPPGDQIDRN